MIFIHGLAFKKPASERPSFVLSSFSKFEKKNIDMFLKMTCVGVCFRMMGRIENRGQPVPLILFFLASALLDSANGHPWLCKCNVHCLIFS